MKKIIITLSMVAIIVACNQNDTSNTSEAEGANPEQPAADAPAAEKSLSDNPDYQKGLELEAKSDCATCHKLDEKLVGPSFKDIAQKYANADQAMIDTLAGKIINGGAGNWGQVPMTAHPTLSKEDAQTLVKYVLLQK
jgi:cytochrome c